jgi:hypothetical protein
MALSLSIRFFDLFLKGFWSTVRDRIIDAALLGATLVFQLMRRGFTIKAWQQNAWENLAPWVWVICLIVSWHAIKSAITLAGTISSELRISSTYQSPIFSPAGRPVEGFIKPSSMPLYRARIWVFALLVLAISASISYFVLEKSRSAEKARTTEPETPKGPPPNTPIEKDEGKDKPAARKIIPNKHPLEIVSFDSLHEITIANSGSSSIYVVNILMNVREPNMTTSYSLGFEIEPDKTHTFDLKEKDKENGTFRSVAKLADTWKEHLARVTALYQTCGMSLVFFSPSDPSFQQIREHYTQTGRELGYDEVPSVLHYWIHGLQKINDEQVPIVITTMVNSTCPNN